MDTANAFDMLVLPILQGTGAMIAASALLRGLWSGVDRLLGPSGRVEPGRDRPWAPRRPAIIRPHAPAGSPWH